jgi:hypothetical protein
VTGRYERHPLNFFPPLPQDRIEALAADIQVNGQRDPIWLFEGKILDGWGVHQACVLAGKELRIEEYTGDAPLDFVLSRNASRRSLSNPEKAFVGARLVIAVFEDRARSRMLAGTPSAPGREGGKAADEAARVIGIGARTIERARKVLRTSVALANEVENGTLVGGLKAAEVVCGLSKEDREAFMGMGPDRRKDFLAKLKATRDAAKETERSGQVPPVVRLRAPARRRVPSGLPSSSPPPTVRTRRGGSAGA